MSAAKKKKPDRRPPPRPPRPAAPGSQPGGRPDGHPRPEPAPIRPPAPPPPSGPPLRLEVREVIANRFEVLAEQFAAPGLTVVDAVDQESGTRAWVRLSSHPPMIRRLEALASAGRDEPRLQAALDAGRVESLHGYYLAVQAPQFLPGAPLPEIVSALSLADSLALMLDLSDLVGVLNRKGLVLGELSPGQVLVDEFDYRKVHTLLLPTDLAEISLPMKAVVENPETGMVGRAFASLDWFGGHWELNDTLIRMAEEDRSLEGWMVAALQPGVAPEWALPGAGRERADIFSLGSLLGWLMVEDLALPDPSPRQLIPELFDPPVYDDLYLTTLVENVYYSRLQGFDLSILADLPPALAQVLVRAAAPDPARRFASAADFAAALAALPTGGLQVQVTDDRGQPVEGARVRLRRLGGEALFFSVESDDEGLVEAELLAPGRYRVEVDPVEGYQSAVAEEIEVDREVVDVRLALKPVTLGDRLKKLWGRGR